MANLQSSPLSGVSLLSFFGFRWVPLTPLLRVGFLGLLLSGRPSEAVRQRKFLVRYAYRTLGL